MEDHLCCPEQADGVVPEEPLEAVIVLHLSVVRLASGGEQNRDAEPVREEDHEQEEQEQRQQQERGHRARRIRRLAQDTARQQQPLQQTAPERHDDAHGEGGHEDGERERHVGVHRDLERALEHRNVLGEGRRGQVVRAHPQRRREQREREERPRDREWREQTRVDEETCGDHPEESERGGSGGSEDEHLGREQHPGDHRSERILVDDRRHEHVERRCRGYAAVTERSRGVGGRRDGAAGRIALDGAPIVPAHVVAR